MLAGIDAAAVVEDCRAELARTDGARACVAVGRVQAGGSALNLVTGEVASVVQLGNRVRVRIGPLTAEVTAASAEKLDLARGGRAYASFKATGTRLVPLS